jgi:hypothetical protein
MKEMCWVKRDRLGDSWKYTELGWHTDESRSMYDLRKGNSTHAKPHPVLACRPFGVIAILGQCLGVDGQLGQAEVAISSWAQLEGMFSKPDRHSNLRGSHRVADWILDGGATGTVAAEIL